VTEAAIAQTSAADSREAGSLLGQQLTQQLRGERPDAVILFASSRHDYAALLAALHAACAPRALVGCSSAGEFTTGSQAEGAACAVAILAPEMRFTAAIGHGLREDRVLAARELAAALQGRRESQSPDYAHRAALVLTDALAGQADDLIDHLSVLTAGRYQFFGGGAGDDARFERTHVFYGTGDASPQAVPDAAVALEILSNKPVAIGVRHGWQPASKGMRVTESAGMRLGSLDAIAAVEAVEEYAEGSGQSFDRAAPLPFFLHNVIGLDSGDGYKLRVPLGVQEDGSLLCAADVPEGSTARVMAATSASATEAAAAATQDAVAQLERAGHEPAVALFFDCVATRLRMGKEFGFELEAVQRALGKAQFVGFNTYGQIARAEGQFSGFHNCTAVVCVLPK